MERSQEMGHNRLSRALTQLPPSSTWCQNSSDATQLYYIVQEETY
jgi:hypothetical protein